jgi:tRNA U38,U39,U40 pseudouridine synthase TruA
MIGVHDFRYFYRFDQGNTQNFVRQIHEAKILPMKIDPEDDERSLYYLRIEGTAFLWY